MHANAAWSRDVLTGPLPEPALLPLLEEDGRTVRIESNRDYQRIYEGFLWRGVLPVRTDCTARAPKKSKVKERRVLRFCICGLDLNIEVKARVRSVEPGITVFVIQQIDRHRYTLASLARDMPVLV